MSRHILVTGGCGFIGSHFVRYLLQQRPDDRVTNLDALTYSGNLQNLSDVASHPQYRFVQGDILDRPLVEQLLSECDAVVHLAAESHVDRSLHDPRPFFRTNVTGTLTLLDAARAMWPTGDPKRFVHVSTDEVYGALPLQPVERKFDEQSPLNPSSPYSSSKMAGDLLAAQYHRTHGLDVVITRCGNNFGPNQYPEKVIPRFITHLLQDLPVPLFGDGRHVRDWLHVVDHCEAMLSVLERGTAGEVYNIGANNEWSNRELAEQLVALCGGDKSQIESVADRPGHDLRYALDCQKIQTQLGWQPTRSAWPAGLESTVAWYRENVDWWQPLKKML